jgi:hypothetical protein
VELLLPAVLAALLSAQTAVGSVPHAVEAVAAGGTEVTVRIGDEDEAVDAQVRRVLPQAIRLAGRWGSLPANVLLTVHATHAELERATGRSGNPWMRAWARVAAVDLQSPRSWSRGRASDEDLTRILAHELTHCALFHATGRDGRAREIPTWFVEGMASVAAAEHHHVFQVEAVTSPTTLLRSDPKAVYGTADRAFRELVQRFGEARVRLVITRLGEGHAFDAAFRSALDVTPAEFESDLVGRLSALAARD